jgi:hypothetical protein
LLSSKWPLAALVGLFIVVWLAYLLLPLIFSVVTWIRSPRAVVVEDIEVEVPFGWISADSGKFVSSFRKMGRTISNSSYIAAIVMTSVGRFGPIEDSNKFWTELVKRNSDRIGLSTTRQLRIQNNQISASCAEWQDPARLGMSSVCFIPSANLLFEYTGSSQHLSVFYDTIRSIKRRSAR